jgi:hypothetical protein
MLCAICSHFIHGSVSNINTKVSFFLRPFFIGVGGVLFTFMVMMMTPPLVTSIFSALLYFSLAIWIGRVQPQSLWYAPLLMNILIWVIFIPMGMEFWPPKIRIWYFLIPPLVALPAAYFGTYVGSRTVFAKMTSQTVPELTTERGFFSYPYLKSFGAYLLLFLIGFAGMFICHILLFVSVFLLRLSFGAGYTLSYLLVYPSLAVMQSWRHRDRWFVNAIVLCLVPALWWFSILWSAGKLHLSEISFSNSSIMMVIMPLTLVLSSIAAFVSVRLKKPRTE